MSAVKRLTNMYTRNIVNWYTSFRHRFESLCRLTERTDSMILDNRKNASRYIGISPQMDRALEFVASGRSVSRQIRDVVELDGDSVYCRRIDSETVPPDSAEMEVHRDFADIHLVLEGAETIRVRTESEPIPSELYDADTDSAILPMGEGSDVEMKPGLFAILFPGEVHAPLLGRPGGSKLSKLVIKVRTAV